MTSVSVVVPLYDHGSTVGAALDSLLAQDHVPTEIIVVDDASTDGGAAIVRAYGAPVVLITQEHGGAGAARARGIGACTGEFVAFLDADDIAPAGSLRSRAIALAGRPELDAVFGGVSEFIDESSPPVGGRAPRGTRAARLAGTMLIRASALGRFGAFRGGYVEWADWITRALDDGLRYEEIPEVVLLRRLHASNSGAREKDRLSEYVAVVKASLDRRRTAR